MNRESCAFLAAVALCAAPLGGASAQYVPPPVYRGGPPPVIYQDGPGPVYWFDDDDDGFTAPRSRAPRAYRQRSAQSGVPGSREADAALPAPGFAVPDSQRAPGPGGHQLDAVPQQDVIRPPAPVGPASNAGAQPGAQPNTAALPPEDQPEVGEPKELPPELKRQLVDYPTREPAGTLIVDTDHTMLYLVLGGGKAMRYGIGVGREGFTWAGTERISKMKEWPDWFPPAEMIERQPYLPRFMAGGDGNPLGARALYLGKTLYRIHGTNQPSTIGKYVSSGCIRLLNQDIEDLYSRVQVGTRVVVLPSTKTASTAAATPATGLPSAAPVNARSPQNAAVAAQPGAIAPPTDITAPNTGPAITSSPLPAVR